MNYARRLAVAAITVATVAVSIVGFGGAASADPTSNAEYGRSYGKVVRADLFQHGGFQGYRLRMYGKGSCTSSLDDTDLSLGSMPGGWNDAVSSIRDFAGCDTNLFWDSLSSLSTGYRNYGSVGSSVPSGWNDQTSAVRLS